MLHVVFLLTCLQTENFRLHNIESGMSMSLIAEALTRKCPLKKSVLRNFAKSGPQPAALLKRAQAQEFFCEFCKISKNTFFYRTTSVATSFNELIIVGEKSDLLFHHSNKANMAFILTRYFIFIKLICPTKLSFMKTASSIFQICSKSISTKINPVWFKDIFLRQIQFFLNHWRRASNILRLFTIKPFHILIIKIYSFSLDLKSYVK